MEIQFDEGGERREARALFPQQGTALHAPGALLFAAPILGQPAPDRICLDTDEVRQCLTQAGPDMV